MGKHRPKPGSYRLIEIDVTGRDWMQRLWKLERSTFGHKLFLIQDDGKYKADWSMEDTTEYYKATGEWPPLWKMVRHEYFMEVH